jgi:hypothetical protein
VLVMLVAWHVDLRLDTEHQQGIVLEVFKVEHGHRLVPIWECEKLGLQLLLLSNHVAVVFHLVYNRLLLLEIYPLQVYQDLVPLGNISEQFMSWRFQTILEEEVPKLLVFTSLLEANHFIVCLLMFL